jgi:hypothetical protein
MEEGIITFALNWQVRTASHLEEMRFHAQNVRLQLQEIVSPSSENATCFGVSPVAEFFRHSPSERSMEYNWITPSIKKLPVLGSRLRTSCPTAMHLESGEIPMHFG